MRFGGRWKVRTCVPKSFCELLSSTNLISFCITDFSPSELLLKKAIALLQAMEPMLAQEAKEGEQVQQNLTGGMCVVAFY